MSTLLIFGLGYTGQAIATLFRAAGWRVEATGRAGTLDFGDTPAIRATLARADAVLSSVPPADGADPVLTGGGRVDKREAMGAAVDRIGGRYVAARQ